MCEVDDAIDTLAGNCQYVGWQFKARYISIPYNINKQLMTTIPSNNQGKGTKEKIRLPTLGHACTP